jgi:hypothetical protein
MIYRRRTERVVYPESPEAYAESGFDPEMWREDGVGFWAKIICNITGAEERAELKSRLTLYRGAADETRQDYYREIAWRVPEWGFSTENAAGDIVRVPAPAENEDNFEASELLPYGVGAWLIEQVRTIHLPKRKPWISVGTGDTSTPTPISSTERPEP